MITCQFNNKQCNFSDLRFNSNLEISCLLYDPSERIYAANENTGFKIEFSLEKFITDQMPLIYLIVNDKDYITAHKRGISIPTEFKTRTMDS